MKFLVLSVEHSATRFVKNHLLRGHASIYQHLVPLHRQYIETLVERYAVIFVPLRHPLQIARSWAAKNMRMEYLAGRFHFLATLFAGRTPPHWVPVDAPDRDSYVKAANDKLGLTLDAGDWPKVGHDRSGENYRMTDKETELARLAIEPHRKFFECFYPDPMEVSKWN